MKDKFGIVQAISMITQIGLTMIVSIFLCMAAGCYIDKRFGTSLTIFFVVFGIISGYCGAYSTLKQFIKRFGKNRSDIFAGYEEFQNDSDSGCPGSRTGQGDSFEDDEEEDMDDEQRP